MKADIFELKGQIRHDFGKNASRRLRQAKQVPAIVYGGKKAPQAISLDHNSVIVALDHESFYSHVLTLYVDSNSQKVVLKALQRHPFKRKVLHLDLMRVSADEPIIMHVPLHFIGEEQAVGVRAGGVVVRHMNDIEIQCLPKDLPEFIEVDISQLALNTTLRLSDLQLPSGVKVMASLGSGHDNAVVAIQPPKSHVEVATVDTKDDNAQEKSGQKDNQ